VPDSIKYTIRPKHLAAHLFEVSVTVQVPAERQQRFKLPVWIPGSYMIREFARHIVTLSASANNATLAIEKLDKCTWQCAPCAGKLTLIYEVYAWDLSVRAAHLDEMHGFFNGTSMFLLPEGFETARCEVEIIAPTNKPDWKIATALSRAPQTHALQTHTPQTRTPQTPLLVGTSKHIAPNTPPIGEFGQFGFGKFYAANYDELIDHPVEMGTFTHASFEACGVPHHIVLTGKHRADTARLCVDFKKICEAQIKLFEPETHAAPMREYWFLVMVVGDGFGGLEHRASTALVVGREDLPLAHDAKMSTGYRKLLSLASHEYFHTWNVKRIKPESFIDYDLFNENYTRQLWFFEGFTDYYDDLMLARTGLITPLEYLEVEAENIGKVYARSGRSKQSVAESSFDAWVKYYRQDENAPNAIVSYYQKGSVVGLALDLTIRERTQGAKSLDDVMRTLWNEYGKRGIGVAEGEIEIVAARVTGIDLQAFFSQAVYGTADISLPPLLSSVGIDMSWRAPSQTKADDPISPSLGARIGSEINGDARLSQVFDGGSAQLAGLSAQDVVLAVDGLRVTAASLERRIKSYPTDATIEVLACRRDEIMIFRVNLQAQAAHTCVFVTRDEPASAKAARLCWLGPTSMPTSVPTPQA
jgi:predicted metalloprotease with PDZ domain